MGKRRESADQPLNLLDVVGASHLGDSSTLFRVAFYSSMGEHKTQELSSFYVGRTLVAVEAHTVFAKSLEDFLQIRYMLFA